MPLPWLSDVDDKQLFQAQNFALPVWALLILAPRWNGTHAIALLTAVFFAVMYTGLMANLMLHPAAAFSITEFASWDGVAKLLATPSSVLPAWVHYLCTDLIVARWEVQDAAAHGVPQLLMAPVLVVTCLFAPAGFLLYVAAVRPLFCKSTASGASAKRD